jgi:hypothetical protein
MRRENLKNVILQLGLSRYGCDTDEGVWEQEEVTKGCKILHNEKLENSYCSPTIVGAGIVQSA